MVGILRRQVEREAQARRGAFCVPRQRDLVLIVRRFLRVLVVIILDHPVEVQALGPGQDRLEAVNDEAVAAVGLIAVLALGGLASLHLGRGRRGGGFVPGGTLARRAVRQA